MGSQKTILEHRSLLEPGDNRERQPGITAINIGATIRCSENHIQRLRQKVVRQHKSQGFGSAGEERWCSRLFEFVKGEKSNCNDFWRVNTTWSKIKGAERFRHLLFRLSASSKMKILRSIPLLWKSRKSIESSSCFSLENEKVGRGKSTDSRLPRAFLLKQRW